ncbi:hypothetical protein CEW46_30450 [Bacillus cereus]|nr:hypothetical protein CEW46_30450 [Bacillus cereus]
MEISKKQEKYLIDLGFDRKYYGYPDDCEEPIERWEYIPNPDYVLFIYHRKEALTECELEYKNKLDTPFLLQTLELVLTSYRLR